MGIEIKAGQMVRVTVSKTITRAGAAKTIERLFMKDKAVAAPLARRARNFTDLPKRRGGRIWTKYANKIHPKLEKGASATIKATPQAIRDLASVADFVNIG